MAMINCPECGKKISDKAQICPNCGCEMRRFTICKECGTKIDTDINSSTCPECGRPINLAKQSTSDFMVKIKANQKKLAIIGGACVFLIIALTVVIAVTKNWNVEVGDYISFGKYEQDNNTSNGKEDIEWLVLERKEDRVLVISRYALDCQQYNEIYEDVTWEACTLRKWLNNDFLNSAFTDGEQAKIPTVMVPADENPEYSTDPGDATQDKVFLLSIDEAEKYFNSDRARICQPTDYAIANGVYENDEGNCFWPLRSPGKNQFFAACVENNGNVRAYGGYVHVDSSGVRPAFWLDLKY